MEFYKSGPWPWTFDLKNSGKSKFFRQGIEQLYFSSALKPEENEDSPAAATTS